MKRILINTGLALALTVGLGAPAAFAAKKKTKPSAEHIAAIKQCKADYKTAVAAAKGKKGKEHREAIAAAKRAERECEANAPK